MVVGALSGRSVRHAVAEPPVHGKASSGHKANGRKSGDGGSASGSQSAGGGRRAASAARGQGKATVGFENADQRALGFPKWAHAGDDESDLIRDNVYIEDESFRITDVCGVINFGFGSGKLLTFSYSVQMYLEGKGFENGYMQGAGPKLNPLYCYKVVQFGC